MMPRILVRASQYLCDDGHPGRGNRQRIHALHRATTASTRDRWFARADTSREAESGSSDDVVAFGAVEYYHYK